MKKENKMYFTKIYGTPPVFVQVISENLDVFCLEENNGYGYTYKYNNFETLSKNKINNEYTTAGNEIRYSRGKKYNKKQDFHVFETKIYKSNIFSKICILPNFLTITIYDNIHNLSEQKGCQILKDKNTNTECAVLVSIDIEESLLANILNKQLDLKLKLGLIK